MNRYSVYHKMIEPRFGQFLAATTQSMV